MSIFKKLFGNSDNQDKSQENKPEVPFKLNLGDYIEDPKYGIGKLLTVEKSDEWLRCSFDFDIGSRNKSWKISNLNSLKFNVPNKSKIDNHLQFRNYELGDKRYLTRQEMESLKEGDLVLSNRKGFARIISFSKNDSGNDIMNLEYLDSGQRNTFNRFENGGALVRFSFKHDLKNEFWEKIGSQNQTIQTNELEMIEKDLKITLPKFYKTFLLNYPNELLYYNRKRLNRKEKFFELELLNQMEDLKQNYLYFEEFDLTDYWPIGNDGIGNYYAIKKNGKDENVYIIDHEIEPENSVSVLSRNLKEFTTKLIMREMVNSYRILNK